MLSIRINGRGNAWPISLGQEHPFYNKNNPRDLSNASYSIIKRIDNKVEKELLIDAGHGTVPLLIKENNRMPEAVFLTHPHIDHTLGVDWVAHSHFRYTKTKYPLYASKMCWEMALKNFPQYENIIEYKELLAAVERDVDEFPGITVTFYPVFHGESAFGAGMLLFKYKDSGKLCKILFTGDLLCPLLRKKDYEELSDCDVIYTDSNNRLPYPKCNHWSIASFENLNLPESEIFRTWVDEKAKNLNYLCSLNTPFKFSAEIHTYFNEFLMEQYTIGFDIPFSIIDFAKRISPKYINIVHYSGKEDVVHNNHNMLSESELLEWTQKVAKENNVDSKFIVPKVGEEFSLI